VTEILQHFANARRSALIPVPINIVGLGHYFEISNSPTLCSSCRSYGRDIHWPLDTRFHFRLVARSWRFAVFGGGVSGTISLLLRLGARNAKSLRAYRTTCMRSLRSRANARSLGSVLFASETICRPLLADAGRGPNCGLSGTSAFATGS